MSEVLYTRWTPLLTQKPRIMGFGFILYICTLSFLFLGDVTSLTCGTQQNGLNLLSSKILCIICQQSFWLSNFSFFL
uniref:Uncharacterized protein n=1 Tax=Populus trichocarpa TaxID=3694 RepID=U5G2I8_POPTR